MKLSKYAQLVRRNCFCNVIHVSDDGIWLGTYASVYKAAGMPNIEGNDEIATVLDLDAKAIEKVKIKEDYCHGVHAMYGMNLSEDTSLDIEAVKMPLLTVWKGNYASALQCKDGELVFYDESYLAPLADIFKDSDYVQMFVRAKQNGDRYIIVKNGIEVIAAIAPIRLISDEFLQALTSFGECCKEQYKRDYSKGLLLVNGDGEMIEPGQMTMGDIESEN